MCNKHHEVGDLFLYASAYPDVIFVQSHVSGNFSLVWTLGAPTN